MERWSKPKRAQNPHYCHTNAHIFPYAHSNAYGNAYVYRKANAARDIDTGSDADVGSNSAWDSDADHCGRYGDSHVDGNAIEYGHTHVHAVRHGLSYTQTHQYKSAYACSRCTEADSSREWFHRLRVDLQATACFYHIEVTIPNYHSDFQLNNALSKQL